MGLVNPDVIFKDNVDATFVTLLQQVFNSLKDRSTAEVLIRGSDQPTGFVKIYRLRELVGVALYMQVSTGKVYTLYKYEQAGWKWGGVSN